MILKLLLKLRSIWDRRGSSAALIGPRPLLDSHLHPIVIISELFHKKSEEIFCEIFWRENHSMISRVVENSQISLKISSLWLIPLVLILSILLQYQLVENVVSVRVFISGSLVRSDCHFDYRKHTLRQRWTFHWSTMQPFLPCSHHYLLSAWWNWLSCRCHPARWSASLSPNVPTSKGTTWCQIYL